MPPSASRPSNSSPSTQETSSSLAQAFTAVSPRSENAVPLDTRGATGLDEGVIDLCEGADNSRFPDVFQYLQLVAEGIGETGTAADMAEKGRRHLYQCMELGDGMFIPYHSNTGDKLPPSSSGITRDGATGPRALASPSNPWAALLANHLDAIGDAAWDPVETLVKRMMAFNPSRNSDILSGYGFLPECPINKLRLLMGFRGLLRTNIRSPIPDIPSDFPLISPSRFRTLVSLLYHQNFHPATIALQNPGYNEGEVMARRSEYLLAWGAPLLDPPAHAPRYQAPWSRWAQQAELRLYQNPAAYYDMIVKACLVTGERQRADRYHWQRLGWAACHHRRRDVWCWECLKAKNSEDEWKLSGYMSTMAQDDEGEGDEMEGVEEEGEDDMGWLDDVHSSGGDPLDVEDQMARLRATAAELGVKMLRYEGESDESYLACCGTQG